MRVAVIYDFFPHYRAPVMRELLHNATHRYTLVADEKPIDPTIRAWQVEDRSRFIHAPYRQLAGNLHYQKGLLGLALRRNFDAVIFMAYPNFISTWLAAFAARLTGKRVYFWTHGWPRTERGPKAWVRCGFYRLANALLLYGQAAKIRGLAHGFTKESLHVIYNSLDYERQREIRSTVTDTDISNARSRMFARPDWPVVICSARLTPSCRLDLLLNAQAELRDQGHCINVLLVGDGPERAHLEQQAQRLQIPVHFHGACYDERTLAILTMTAHVTVSPGKIGLTAMQSLAYGVPVITHGDMEKQGPEAEAIVPEQTGAFFHPGDVSDLSRVIRQWTITPPGMGTRQCCYDVLERWYNPAFQRKAIDRAVSGFPSESPGLSAGSSRGEAPAGPVCIMDYRLAPFAWTRLQAAARHNRILGLEMSAETSAYAWDKIDQPGDFERVTVFQDMECDDASAAEIIRRVHAVLDRHQPSVVTVFGWSFRWSLAALLWSLQNRVPAIVLSDSTALSNSRGWWKESIKRRIIRLFSAGIVAGTPQREYLHQLGMPADRIFTGWDVVDNDHFAAGAARARARAGEMRQKLGLPEKYFLAVNRFIEVKNLQRLIHAYHQYRATAGPSAWKLVIIGDGPLMPAILKWRTELNLADDILLPGFKQHPQLPHYYGLAGAFILASTSETWGLVVNEAMAAGLPVLVSNHCGCVHDLVEEGRNGFRFNPHDTDALSQLMSRMSARECDLADMGKAGSGIISRWTPGTWAHSVKLATTVALNSPLPTLKASDRAMLHLLIHQ